MKLIDNASGNIGRGITLTSDNKTDKYKISWNCSNIGDGKSYIRIYATLEDTSYKTYFLPIQFLGNTEFEVGIDTSSTFLQFDMIGDARVTAINFETVTDATMEYVKANAGYWDRIKEITSNTGKVRTEMLEGLINMTLNAFSNESGTITQENGVLTFLDGTTVDDSTMAVQITGGAIRIANSKLQDGTWNWTTAINGSGINAATIIADTFAGINITSVNITSGTITGGTINGVTISSSEFKSYDDSNTEMSLNNGRITFKNGDSQGYLFSDELALFGENNSTAVLQTYNDMVVGEGAMLYSSNNMILGCTAYGDAVECSNSGGIRIKPSYSNSCVIEGDFEVWGEKPAVVPTQHFGVRTLYCEEADRSYFSTKGIAETFNCECTIKLDPIFLEVIELNSTYPYLISLTPYSSSHIWVDSVEDGQFVVKSDKDTKFMYDLKAIRISFINKYLEEKHNYSNKDLAKIQRAAIERMV